MIVIHTQEFNCNPMNERGFDACLTTYELVLLDDNDRPRL